MYNNDILVLLHNDQPWLDSFLEERGVMSMMMMMMMMTTIMTTNTTTMKSTGTKMTASKTAMTTSFFYTTTSLSRMHPDKSADQTNQMKVCWTLKQARKQCENTTAHTPPPVSVVGLVLPQQQLSQHSPINLGKWGKLWWISSNDR